MESTVLNRHIYDYTMSMHAEAWSFLVNKSLEVSPKSIIDIGGRNINGTPRDLWPKSEYMALDHIGGDGVDIVADATNWEPARKWDMGLCTEVFEHVTPEDYRKMLNTLGKAVNTGGTLLVTCATEPRHPHAAIGTPGMPVDEFYGNVDVEDLCQALVETNWQCMDVIVDRSHGDIYIEAVNAN